MKKVILTIEVEIDEKRAAKIYPKFGIDYERETNGAISETGLLDYARRFVTTEESYKHTGHRVSIRSAAVVPNGARTILLNSIQSRSRVRSPRRPVCIGARKRRGRAR